MAFKLNGASKWIGLGLTLLVMFSSGIKTATVMSKDIEANQKRIDSFEILYNNDQDCIREDIKEIKSDIKMLLQRK